MDEEYDVTVTVPAFKFRWLDVLIAGFTAVTDFFDTVSDLLMAHANYGRERARAENEMRASIERITE